MLDSPTVEEDPPIAGPSLAGPSSVPTVDSLSVSEAAGHSMPLRHPARRLKFLIEWREKTIVIVLEDSETVGIMNICFNALQYMCMKVK